MKWLRFFPSLLCRLGLHKYQEAAYGYPAHSKYWMEIQCCERCSRNKRVIDNLFADERPADYRMEVAYMEPKPGFKLLFNQRGYPGLKPGPVVFREKDFPKAEFSDHDWNSAGLVPMRFGAQPETCA